MHKGGTHQPVIPFPPLKEDEKGGGGGGGLCYREV